MKCRTWGLFAWSWALLAASMLNATWSNAAELRRGGVTRATYRTAALQDNEYQGDEFQEEMPADASPSDEVRSAPAPTPAPARRSVQPATPRYQMPMAQPAWDADVIPSEADACGDGACYQDDGFGCYGTWGSLEYVLWWRKARSTPPLVTTTTTVVDQSIDGRLGQPNTRILLGEDQFRDHLQPGGRIDLGMWIDRSRTVGVGMRYTGLADDDLNYQTNSGVNSVLAVPFFNLDPTVNAEDTLLVAHPLDGTTGSINVTGHNETLLGDVYMRFIGARSGSYRVDVLGGYFFSSINEDLILQTSTTMGGTDINVRDRFRTKNNYQGASIGLSGQFDRGPWKVNALAKIAFTNVHQTSVVDGITTIGGTPQAPLSGLFAQPSNSGMRERDEFAVVPELGVNWVYRMGRGVDLSFGYTFVYWSEAMRAGQQINRRIDPSQTVAQPTQRLMAGDYWAQGLNFGVAWQY
jgi:hypothetical protein